MGEDRIPPGMSRHTVAQAADMLGISTGAVRNRLSRGTLRSVKEGGTVYVLLPADMSRHTERDTADTPGGIPDAQADDLREQVRYLRDQLRREQEAHGEARRIIAALTSRIPQLEAPQTASEAPEAPEPRHDTAGPQTATERPPADDTRRPWWRRVFGG